MAISVLAYATETCMITVKEKQYMQTPDTSLLKHVSGYCQKDQRHNEDIRAERDIYSHHEWQDRRYKTVMDGEYL